jgi:hypothetical protein
MIKQFVAVQYMVGDKKTDFYKMIKLPEYNNSLFLYNENASEYLSCNTASGGGNAIIRPYRMDTNKSEKNNNSRSLGIPTGHIGGFDSLNELCYNYPAKALIDLSVNMIDQALTINKHIRRVYWSTDDKGFIGTGIFTVNDDVKAYITNQIEKLAEKHGYTIIDSKDTLHDLSIIEEHLPFREVHLDF